VGWRVVAAAVGLSIAGVSAPIAVTALAATNMLLGPPLVASALVALLVLAPAALCLVTALSGGRRVAALLARAGNEAELAVLRVFAGTLLFGYALAMAASASHRGSTADCVPIAAAALVVAWTMLLFVILWPAAPPLRRNGALALDVALFSAFLHFGGGDVAGWYPFYLLVIFYAGLRFGLGALLASAIASVLGFAAVVLSTEIWRQQPALASGLLFALAALPACFAGTLHALAAARARATGAETDRQTTLRLIADTLRGSPATARAARAVPPPINDILDLAELEAGTFAPPIETFDLRALIKHTLMPMQVTAAEKGMALRWRVDPRLPDRLRGHAQAFARILSLLADHAVEVARTATVRVAVEPGAGDAHRVRLNLRVDGLGARRDPGLPGEADPLALRLVQRLLAMVGGTFAVDRVAGQRVRLTATLPLTIEEGASARVLDLARRPVLIATEDDELARELAEPLAVWNADPSWPGDIAVALAGLCGGGEAERPVLIVDGRDKLLSALSLAHHAARSGAGAPFVILIAEDGQIASLGEVEEAGLDGFIPAPVTERWLANALDALPLGRPETARGRPEMATIADPPRAAAEPLPPLPSPPSEAAPTIGERITPIASHPKFAPETTAAVDPRVIEGLRELGGGPDFLGELIETFRADSRQIMQRIEHAAAAADAAGFAQGIGALRRAAGNLGGTQLCDLLVSLHGLTASELRQRGATHVQRLDAEIERLAAALLEFLPAGAVQRR